MTRYSTTPVPSLRAYPSTPSETLLKMLSVTCEVHDVAHDVPCWTIPAAESSLLLRAVCSTRGRRAQVRGWNGIHQAHR